MPIKLTKCGDLKLCFDDRALDGIGFYCKSGCPTLDRQCIEGDSYGPPCGGYYNGIALSLGEMRERMGLNPLSGKASK